MAPGGDSAAPLLADEGEGGTTADEHWAQLHEHLRDLKYRRTGAAPDGEPADARQGSSSRVKAAARGIQRKFKEAADNRAAWRKRLADFLERKEVHILLIVLLLIDLAAVTWDVITSISHKTADIRQLRGLLALCKGDVAACDAFAPTEGSDLSFYVSITILVLFLANVVALLAAWGWTFFLHPGYVVDFVVVVVAIVLELAKDADATVILAVATLWRIVRVMHGIFEVADESFERELGRVEARVEALEALHRRDMESLRSQPPS